MYESSQVFISRKLILSYSNTAMEQLTREWPSSFNLAPPDQETLPDCRQKLNNYLQVVYRDHPRCHLTWKTWPEGPDNQPAWHAIVYRVCLNYVTIFPNLTFDIVDEVECGRRDGPSRCAAMEVASKSGLIALDYLG